MFKRMDKRMVWIHIGAFILFVTILANVQYGEVWVAFDRQVSEQMVDMRKVWLTPLCIVVTDMNSMWGATLFSVVTVAIFAFKKWWHDIVFYLIVMFGATALFGGIKVWVARSRPELSILEAGGYSFPSGHTTMATAMALGLYMILHRKIESIWGRRILLVLALGWAVLIGCTRLYLGVHWLTDVVGGFALGLWWVTCVTLVWKQPTLQ
jgi:undecaprenyl-diphosphatase